jgi:hypothetical protein
MAVMKQQNTAPVETDDFFEEDEDDDEQFALPDSLLKSADIQSDEDWDDLPVIDIDALKARNKK